MLSLLSLLWTALSYVLSSNTETALAFTISLLLLTFLEYAVRWYKATVHNGTTYVFSDEGLKKISGSAQQTFVWKDFAVFLSDFDSRFGNIVSQLPLAGFILSDISRDSFRLFHTDDILFSQDNFFLPVPPEHKKQVESILKDRLVERRPHFVKSGYLTGLIIFTLFVVVLLLLLLL